ncbi:hypothetical protein BB561_005042 [Smittium simulii]|uniref:Protein transport protein sec1 n=1 Tax=Smittium simulii TaxID=133385 RepID=A0A2T9YCI3_9FUNG|nr:hypothetical protein BB561_005042 [Smittium simulii]
MLNVPDVSQRSDTELPLPSEKRPVYTLKKKGFRHEHISDAQERIMKEIDNLAEKNKAIVEMQSGKQQNLSKMRDIVSAMPKFKAKMAEYSIHVSLMQNCMKVFSSNDLANIAFIEQNLVMMTTPEKEPYTSGSFDVANLLSNANVDPLIKTRLLIIYLLTNPTLTENERSQIVSRANLGREAYDSLSGLKTLMPIEKSFDISNKIRDSCKVVVKSAKEKIANAKNYGNYRGANQKATGPLGFKGASPLLGLISSDKSGFLGQGNRNMDNVEQEKEPYDVSRYQPVLKDIIEALVLGQLDSEFFRCISAPKNDVDDISEKMKDMSFRKKSDADSLLLPTGGISRSLRSTKATWQKSKSQSVGLNGDRSNNNSGANTPGMLDSGDRFDKSGSKTPIVRKGPKLIVYIIGGITYSEIRAANEIANKYNSDLIIGSSHTMTPSGFLDGLSSLISADRGADYDESKVLANELPGAKLEPSSHIYGYATENDIDPLVKYEEITSRLANRNKQGAAVAELSIEEAFMNKLKSGEDQWNNIKSMSSTRKTSGNNI